MFTLHRHNFLPSPQALKLVTPVKEKMYTTQKTEHLRGILSLYPFVRLNEPMFLRIARHQSHTVSRNTILNKQKHTTFRPTWLVTAGDALTSCSLVAFRIRCCHPVTVFYGLYKVTVTVPSAATRGCSRLIRTKYISCTEEEFSGFSEVKWDRCICGMWDAYSENGPRLMN